MLYADVNVVGSVNVLECCRQYGVRKIIYASTGGAVYGEPQKLPVAEDHPICPLDPYGASKHHVEHYLEVYRNHFDISYTALRYPNVYGPRQRPDSMYAAAVPIFIRRMLDGQPITIFGDGRQTRDLIFVEDVVRANLIAAEHPAAPGQVFNVSTGLETSVLDLIDVLNRLCPGSPAPIHEAARAGDIHKSVGSTTKAREVLGFRAATSLADGLKATLSWMQ